MRLSGLLLLIPAFASAQGLLNTARFPEALKVFDEPVDKQRALACEVKPLRPQLTYGFKFVTGYVGVFQLKSIEGPGHRFAVLTRITNDDDPGAQPVYLSQFFRLPPAPPKNHANLELDGAFFTGEGSYTVDWVLRDREGRTCRKNWRLQAKVPGHDPELEIAMPPGKVGPIRYEAWKGVPPERIDKAAHPLRLTVFLHVTPLSMRRNKLHPFDEIMLLSSLLSLLQRTPFTEIKLVAFNLDQQKEIFRQEGFNEKGWEGLIDGISSLELATVPYAVLQHPKGHIDFVNKLIEEELSAAQPADAVVFLGPTARQNDKLHREPPARGERPVPAFYYFEFKPYWDKTSAFPDILTFAVKSLSGKIVHIYSPRDFSKAIQQLNT